MPSLTSDILSTTELSVEMKRTIVESLFGKDKIGCDAPAEDVKSSAFWDFYMKSCKQVARRRALRTHQDVLDFVQQVRTGRIRAEVRDKLRSRVTASNVYEEDEMLDRCMDLAARLVTMSDVGSYRLLLDQEQDHESWPDVSSLGTVIDKRFRAQNDLKDMKVKLEKKFTALNLERVAGIEIVWT